MIKRGDVPAKKIGVSYFIPQSWLDDYSGPAGLDEKEEKGENEQKKEL